MINIIVAKANNKTIGKDNKLIWHLPNDLKYFKKLTSGHPIIMGRKTFESLGKPLPYRTNVVITRDEHFLEQEGVEVENSLPKAIERAKKIDDEIFIIGGGNIYEQAMNLADQLYITEVHHAFEGDTFFPDIDLTSWKEISRENHEKDDKHLYDYSFVVYKRVN